MRNEKGFSLIEVLVATAILVPGLVAVATMFPYSVRSNYVSRQTSTATMIISDKMEELRALPLNHASLNAGGGLNPASPTTSYFDYVTVSPTGTVATSTTASATAYLRMWQVAGTNPKTITIVLYSTRSGLNTQRMELARSSTRVTNTF